MEIDSKISLHPLRTDKAGPGRCKNPLYVKAGTVLQQIDKIIGAALDHPIAMNSTCMNSNGRASNEVTQVFF